MFKHIAPGRSDRASRIWTRAAGFPDDYTVEIKTYCDEIGTDQSDAFNFYMSNGEMRATLYYHSNGLKTYTGSSFTEIGSNAVVQDVWQVWRYVVTGGVWETATLDAYLDGVLVEADVDVSYEYAADDGKFYIAQENYFGTNNLAYIDYIKIATGLEPPPVIAVSQVIINPMMN